MAKIYYANNAGRPDNDGYCIDWAPTLSHDIYNNHFGFKKAEKTTLEDFINHKDSTRAKSEYAAIKAAVLPKKISILNIALTDEFIEGDISKTQLYLENLYKENPLIFREVFEATYLQLFIEKPIVFYNFICNIASIDYSWLEEKADSLIIVALSHNSSLVNEATIRAIEYWEQPKHIEYLKQIREFDVPWLNDYKNQVIECLRIPN